MRGVVQVFVVVCVHVVVGGPIKKQAAGFVVKSGGGKKREYERNPFFGRDGTVVRGDLS